MPEGQAAASAPPRERLPSPPPPTTTKSTGAGEPAEHKRLTYTDGENRCVRCKNKFDANMEPQQYNIVLSGKLHAHPGLALADWFSQRYKDEKWRCAPKSAQRLGPKSIPRYDKQSETNILSQERARCRACFDCFSLKYREF